MWTFDAMKQIKKIEEENKKWQLIIEGKINALQTQIIGITGTLSSMPKSSIPLELENRIKEIELWNAKLHSLMIEKTPTGKEKLSKNYFWMRPKV